MLLLQGLLQGLGLGDLHEKQFVCRLEADVEKFE